MRGGAIPILAWATLLLVLLGIGIGWGVYGNTSSPLMFASDPGAKPDGITAVVLTPPKQLQSLGGLTGLLEQARKKFGDTMGYRLLVYPDYASMDRADPNDDRRKLSYTYRGGWGSPSSTAKSSDDVWWTSASSTSRRSSACFAGRPRRWASSRPM